MARTDDSPNSISSPIAIPRSKETSSMSLSPTMRNLSSSPNSPTRTLEFWGEHLVDKAIEKYKTKHKDDQSCSSVQTEKRVETVRLPNGSPVRITESVTVTVTYPEVNLILHLEDLEIEQKEDKKDRPSPNMSYKAF